MSCSKGSASRVRWIVGGFSSPSLGFAAGPVIAGLFVCEERFSNSLSQYFRLPCQYHSTIAPHPFIPLPPTLYNVFLPVFQFSPVSNIPTISPHPFIHLTPTLYSDFLPVLHLSPVSIIPPLLHIHSSNTHTVLCFSPSTSVSPVNIIPPTLHTHSSTRCSGRKLETLKKYVFFGNRRALNMLVLPRRWMLESCLCCIKLLTSACDRSPGPGFRPD